MRPEGAQLLIDLGTAAGFRREVGPVSWVVLEAMASSTTPASGEVACSTRSLAELLGVSRDTAARALRRLVEQGLAMRVECRDEATGRFRSSVYRLDLERAGISIVDPAGSPSTPRSTAPKEQPTTDQLTLLR